MVQLTTGGGSDPSWSPDGTEILFTDGDIWVMDADGTDAVRLTDNADLEVRPTWSPDGTKIAYGSDGADQAIYLMDADGTDPVLLTDHIGADLSSSWSPDGTKLAFACDAGVGDELCTIEPDGSDLTQLTNNDVTDIDIEPSWSPDGTKIVFRRERTGDGGLLYVMNADGTGEVRISFAWSSIGDWSPSWGTSAITRITIDFSPYPPITGLEYSVSGTVTVDPVPSQAEVALPGFVQVSDGVDECNASAVPTGNPGIYAYSCILTAGAPGTVDVTARLWVDPGQSLAPTQAAASSAVIEMPGPPTNVHATSTGARYTVLSWDPPDGPIPFGYQIRCIPVGLPATTGTQNPDVKWVGSLTSPVVVSGFTRGLSYHCMVRARYGVWYQIELGDKYEGPLSQWSETFAVPVVLPSVPQQVRATTPAPPRRQSTRVWWTMPPNDTGAPITFLTRCTSSNGGVTRQATGDTGVWVDNLTRGRTYTCFVRATNSRGSTNSARTNAVKVP